jgi:hypothetical protein
LLNANKHNNLRKLSRNEPSSDKRLWKTETWENGAIDGLVPAAPLMASRTHRHCIDRTSDFGTRNYIAFGHDGINLERYRPGQETWVTDKLGSRDKRGRKHGHRALICSQQAQDSAAFGHQQVIAKREQRVALVGVRICQKNKTPILSGGAEPYKDRYRGPG